MKNKTQIKILYVDLAHKRVYTKIGQKILHEKEKANKNTKKVAYIRHIYNNWPRELT